MKIAYISLGSNLGDRFNFILKAIKLIEKKISKIYLTSKIYETESWGYKSNDFLNACISIKTDLSPYKILSILLSIEKIIGRDRARESQYEDRIIDLDLLFYSNHVINSSKLILPHPKIELRLFILKPLSEIAKKKKHPILKKNINEILLNCKDKSSIKIYEKQLISKLNHIAIEGNIGVGKTSLVKKISKKFKYDFLLENYEANIFLKNFYENPSLYSLKTEKYFLKQRLKELKKFLLRPRNSNTIITDFSIYKSLIFAEQNLKNEDFKKFKNDFFKEIKDFNPPEIIVFLDQKIDKLLINIKKRGRKYESNITGEYLYKIENGYKSFFVKNRKIKALNINVSRFDFVKNENHFETILEIITNY